MATDCESNPFVRAANYGLMGLLYVAMLVIVAAIALGCIAAVPASIGALFGVFVRAFYWAAGWAH